MGVKNLSLIFRGKYRLQVFENRVLRRIFGLKRDDMIAGKGKLHNKELCDLYTLPSIITIKKLRR
jgi:hypothetical protein